MENFYPELYDTDFLERVQSASADWPIVRELAGAPGVSAKPPGAAGTGGAGGGIFMPLLITSR